MNNTFNIEDIKNEITRWATVKNPTLYRHFSFYLGIPSKEVKKLFLSSQEIQDHIDQYFQEERIRERIELQEQLERDLVVLADYLKQIVGSRKTVTTTAIVKATGIARCNIKTFAHSNPELWEQATAVKSIAERTRLKAEKQAALNTEREERRRLKAERKAATEAQHAEAKRIKAEKRAIHEAKTFANAERKRLKAEKRFEEVAAKISKSLISETRAIGKQYEEKLRLGRRERREARAAEQIARQEYFNAVALQPFSSYALCEYAFERGRLVKKIKFQIALQDLKAIGYEGHINIFSDGQDSFGIYVQDIDYLGTFPAKIGFNHHSFSFTWNKRMSEEPKANKKVPLNLQRIETTHKKGFYFRLPENFFQSYIAD